MANTLGSARRRGWVLALALGACGGEVDLGGRVPGEMAAARELCEPCATGASCRDGLACGMIGGNGYCVAPCSAARRCDGRDECTAVRTSEGDMAALCVPRSESCALLPSPTGPHGESVVRCGALTGPMVVTDCDGCASGSHACQPNGCYGGYWCDTEARACVRPPLTCS